MTKRCEDRFVIGRLINSFICMFCAIINFEIQGARKLTEYMEES